MWGRGRGYSTPQANWRQNREVHAMPMSERGPRRSPFHVVHKVPSGHSPYVKAKHVQLIEKDPTKAISLFWASINAGDRVESSLKDMAVVMKQIGRSEEAIEAIKSFRHLCPHESQSSLDNVLLELYKSSGRVQEEIQMLQVKLKHIEEGMAYGGKQTKIARSQGRRVEITIEKEYARLLGNLAWVFMQQKDYKSAEESYRKALSLEPDKNKQCNLAIALIHMGNIAEARVLLRMVQFSADNGADENYAKSFSRASQMIDEIESQPNGAIGMTTTCNKKMVAYGSLPSPFTQPRRSQALQSSSRSTTERSLEQNGDHFSRTLSFEKPVGQLEALQTVAYESLLSPFTQPRSQALQGSSRSTTERSLEQNGDHFSRTLSFEKPVGQLESLSCVGGGGEDCPHDPSKIRRSLVFTEIVRNSMENLKATQSLDESYSMESLKATQHIEESPRPATHITPEREGKKSWADMVEDEQEKEQCPGKYDQKMTTEYQQAGYPLDRTPNRFSKFCKDQQLNDENVDANVIVDSAPLFPQKKDAESTESSLSNDPGCGGYIIVDSELPVKHNDQQNKDTERAQSSLSDDPGCGGYYAQPGTHVKRSLTFPDQQHQNTIDNKQNLSSPLENNVLNMDTYASDLSGGRCLTSLKGVGVKLLSRSSRLQVFRDITPESPKAS